jgi:hypothetical protein
MSAKGGAGSGHTKKHARGSSAKHHHNRGKHNPQHQPRQHHRHTKQPVHTVGAGHKHAKRGLALLDGLPVCAAEALAASLRITGRPVSDAAVLALYERAGCASDAGTCVLCALEAAARFGLAGVRPGSFGQVGQVAAGTSLILGVELPGAHTVYATPAGWWSWGELHCPCEWPDATIGEAWEVAWPS